ncbi:MAG: hypothetical protein V3U54_08570 [Thermodesulfobacteriota bacterium]
MARTRKVKERPAKGTVGFLMTPSYNTDGKLYFRVYNKDARKYIDYEVNATDIEVKILDDSVAFKGESLDWDDKLLGIPK